MLQGESTLHGATSERHEPSHPHLSLTPVVLDGLARQLQSAHVPEVGEALNTLIVRLGEAWRQGPDEAWRATIERVRAHEVFTLMLQDPVTYRAFSKLRGYPGDADTLDTIYGLGVVHQDLAEASSIGRRLHVAARSTPSCRAVRNRCAVLADVLQETLARHAAPRIFCLAAGHLREADTIPWNMVEHLDLFLAADIDPKSVAAVAARGLHPRIEPRQLSLGALLKGRLDDDRFDLAYSTGLYDYLDERTATALTHGLYGRLRPGGEVVIANFASDARDIGYLEAIMDWSLTYRSEAQMRALAPPGSLVRTWRDASQQVVFASFQRPSSDRVQDAQGA